MDIHKSPSGKIIRLPIGGAAFVPNPLPPKIEWTTSLVSCLSKADHLLGMLSREGNHLPNPHLLMRPFITREAVLSSKIEGTQATLGDLLADEAGARVNRDAFDMQEVRNYVHALDYGLKRLKEKPLNLRMLEEIHAHLMHGVRGEHAKAGEFRTVQNWIGTTGCTTVNARYVPPPPKEMAECLKQFEKFLRESQLPPLIHIALCHYQFEAIHPFLDGNGRMGRLLITLLLIERKVLPSPLLYLSAFFENTRDEYYTQLLSISSKGTWNDWLTYFLHGVATQSKDVLSRAERINQCITEWQLKVSGSASETLQTIIKHLAVNPFITVNRIAERLQIAFTTAQRAIEKLESLHIISQVSEGKRDRVYCATKILNILEEPTTL